MKDQVEELARTLDAAIPQAMTRRGVPGLAVGICGRDETWWTAGYGTTERSGGSRVTPTTSFSVQSTSKLFTATTVLLAAQQSLVDLDAPISEYIPEFTVNSVFDEAPAATITLRHCLSHTAGFTHEAPLGSNYDIGNGDFEAHCHSIFDTWLRFPVGHHYEYSNLGIDLAGYALQRVSGLPFDEYARRALFEPLGLSRTSFDPAVIDADADRARGHWRPFELARRPVPVEVPMVAAGGLYTTVADALRFVQLYLRGGESLLAPGTIADQYRIPFASPGQELGYGLGLYVDEWTPGVRIHHHGGSGFGFQSMLYWSPELEFGAVVLTNAFDHSLQNELAHQILEHVAGATAPPAVGARASHPPRNALDGATEFTGEYVGRLDDRFEIRLDGSRLLVSEAETHEAHVVAARTIELDSPAHERYRFAEGQDGTIAYMLAVRDGQAKYRNDADRTPASALDPAYAATYDVLAWGVPTGQLRIEQRGDSPVIEKVSDAYGDSDVPEIALRLTPIAEGLYLSSMGEILDLRSTIPTYANVALVKAGGSDETT